MALSRQNLTTLDRQYFNPAEGLIKGAYILKDYGFEKPDLIIIATGSEVVLVVNAAEELKERGWNIRVVSMPSWYLFEQQDQAYKDSVLLPDVRKRIAVEAGSEFGWEKWVGDAGRIIGMT